MIRLARKIKVTGSALVLCIGFACLGWRMGVTKPDVAMRINMDKERKSEMEAGFDALIKPGALTILGELHGTREVPSLVSDLVRASDVGVPIIIGIEAPESITPVIETFMNSPGERSDLAELLSHNFWTVQDGRSSKSLLMMLNKLRNLHAGGRLIEIFAFDPESNMPRDEGMAKIIIEKLGTINIDDAVTLIVTGNLHARIDEKKWMAWHLRKAHPTLLSLNIAYSGGTAWNCRKRRCGPHPVVGADRGKKRFVELNDNDKRWLGIFYLGRITASSPARDH